MSHLVKLLHIADPTLPIGGYAHSNGLETYVQNKIVKDVASAELFVNNMLSQNLLYNDASFVNLAYDATLQNDIKTIMDLDAECTTLKSAKEIRQASQKLGIRLIKIFKNNTTFSLAETYEKYAITNERGCYCIAFGMYGALLNIPKKEVITAFYFNATTCTVTNAVKLIPLGQLEGQQIIFKLQNKIDALVKRTIELPRDMVGVCNVGLDIRCMQHERLYTRLYMS